MEKGESIEIEKFGAEKIVVRNITVNKTMKNHDVDMLKHWQKKFLRAKYPGLNTQINIHRARSAKKYLNEPGISDRLFFRQQKGSPLLSAAFS